MQLIGNHDVCDGIYPGIQTVGVNQSVICRMRHLQ